jgi:cholesterol oxidase
VIPERVTRFSRRQLLKLGVTAAGATLATGCRSSGLIRPPGVELDLSAQAQLNYRTSLAALRRSVPLPDGTEALEAGTGTLASDPVLLRAARGARPGRADFDVIIIGSGYGGAVCAARLAAHRRPGVKIGVLERGREWVPGTFPQHLLQFHPLNPLFIRRTSWMGEQRPQNPLGLFGFYDGDVQVVIGSGLGGASLTNCAVVLEAEERVFRQPPWPEELRSKDTLRPYYGRARRMLSPQTTPEDRLTPKLSVHLKTAAGLRAKRLWDADAYRAPLAITFDSRTNAQGMRQHGCVQCGDCATGCNVGAKHSLDMNYLPLAWTGGARLFTQVDVSTITKIGELYRVDYVLRPDAARPGRQETGSVTAAVVVIAAGTMGSNAILQRSRNETGLATSAWLGKGFSANGNYLGVVDYQYTDPPVQTNSAGAGVAAGAPTNPVGTYIEGVIDFRRGSRPLDQRVVIEDMSQASSLAGGVALLTLLDLRRAMTLLGMGHDRAEGEVRLEAGTPTVRWPGYDRQPSHAELARLMTQYANALGGKYAVFSPARNYTAHPLGGCRMGESAATGVVNHRGQVFDASAGDHSQAVHAGLYVTDASIMPTALGNNPLLTIAALAERIADLIVNDPSHATLFEPPGTRHEPEIQSPPAPRVLEAP